MDNSQFIVKIMIPSHKLQKSVMINLNETVAEFQKSLFERLPELPKMHNFAILIRTSKNSATFLKPSDLLSVYAIEPHSSLAVVTKCRIGGETDPKKQRRLVEDIQKGNLEKVQEKTTKTTEFNFWIDDKGTDTPLTIAAGNGDVEMMKFFLQNDAFVDFRSGEAAQWKTALHMAAEKNKPKALKFLLDEGADPDVKDANGLTPLFMAATKGSTECALRLLLKGASTEVFDEVFKSPLHQACLKNFDCIVALLIDFGANINASNLAGNTPLHTAATRNFKESVKWLLLRGADIGIKNKSQKNAYELADQAKATEVMEMIKNWNPNDVVLPPPKFEKKMLENVEEITDRVLTSLAESIGHEYSPRSENGIVLGGDPKASIKNKGRGNIQFKPAPSQRNSSSSDLMRSRSTTAEVPATTATTTLKKFKVPIANIFNPDLAAI